MKGRTFILAAATLAMLGMFLLNAGSKSEESSL